MALSTPWNYNLSYTLTFLLKYTRYSPTKLCNGAQMAIFGANFASCIFSELHAAHSRYAF